MNYLKDTEQLGFTDKISGLERLAALNERTNVNSLHISLNFDPSEKLNEEKLRAITDAYMQKIGFGQQPYLVYEHYDAGHPHVHILTTNIKQDGKRISLHNLGRNQSEEARKEIEREFKLVKAQKEQLKMAHEIRPVNVQKVLYGKAETKRAITNVLDAVIPSYKYTSLAELNAVLRLYNVVADRGAEGSRIYKNEGLNYRILDEKGQKVGIPIKASSIYSQPTIKNISRKFTQNETHRQQHKQRVKNAVDLAFIGGKTQSVPALEKALLKERIQLVIRQNDKGIIYGMTYVDHQTKSVFNGSDLGKQYSSNAIQYRLAHPDAMKPLNQRQQQAVAPPFIKGDEAAIIKNGIGNVIEELMQPEHNGGLAYELREEQRRRKRKRLHQ